ncbi:MAG: efflux RND transporter permease subunit, partial [Termitinemataceae bacterium]
MKRRTYLERPVAALSLLVSISLLAATLVLQAYQNPRSWNTQPVYSITLRHHGVDGREMERTVAIPLEDTLFAIPNVKQVLTTSDQGRVRAVVRFSHAEAGTYEAVRDAAQRVYEGLPASAQRPELASSDDSRIPVWSAAVFLSGQEGETSPFEASVALGRLLERVVKPALERIEGVGEVELSGTGVTEMLVALDEVACAARGLEPWMLAQQLAQQDGQFPAGRIQIDDRDVLLIVDGRAASIHELSQFPVTLPNAIQVPLGTLCTIEERQREQERLGRLDGKPAVLISVMGSAGADLGRLSRAIN